MLVYANHLAFQGDGAEEALFKAIGAWLKEQLGFGLHPNKLRTPGEFEGRKKEVRSWLRIISTVSEEPQLYAWVLKVSDPDVRGRQWVTELGVKQDRGNWDLSCVVRTDEHNTLIAQPVPATRPRVINYVATNIAKTKDAHFSSSVSGVEVQNVGKDRASYNDLRTDMERQSRECPIILLSPSRDGEYLVNADHLQDWLLGLGQVVRIDPDFNSYEMAEVMGQYRSAWNGAINVLFTPTSTGDIRNQLFRLEDILAWGETQNLRVSKLLSWVTSNTNINRLRRRISPEGVAQLSLRRRMQAVHAASAQMGAAQLREELTKASAALADQAGWVKTLEDENSSLEARLQDANARFEKEKETARQQSFTIQNLKSQLQDSGNDDNAPVDADLIMRVATNPDSPNPLECLELVETLHGDKCIVLPTAKESAHEVDGFEYGRRLLDMIWKLVTEYRSKLMDGGDNEARKVFRAKEFAAKESETVMANPGLRRLRTFAYLDEDVEMFRHLKIGFAANVTRTIRVHFHWDSERERIVIGYCGEHLPISSH